MKRHTAVEVNDFDNSIPWLETDPAAEVYDHGRWDLGAASYSRKKYAWRARATKCDGCDRERVCVKFDSSDDEYGPIVVCRGCVNEMFATKGKGAPA